MPWLYNYTWDGTGDWVGVFNGTQKNDYFRTQWVECSYQISGGYGSTPRYIFYALALVSILARKESWLVPVALASVMVYSSTASIHALVLAIIRQRMVPKQVTGENYQTILAAGTSINGTQEDQSTDWNGPVWMPVLPMVWDNDCDPVLAVVGFAFLLLLPMQIWSKTFQNKTNPAQKATMFIWALLLLAGLICALINEAYVDMWSFPQLRFCPLDDEDHLPFSNSGVPSVAGQWDGQNWYQWNKTVSDYFVYGNLTVPPPNICMYPCFEFNWPLRDPADIYVSAVSSSEVKLSYSLLFAAYVLVGISGTASLTVLVLRFLARPNALGEDEKDRLTFAYRKSKEAVANLVRNLNSVGAWKETVFRLWLLIVMLDAFILNPIALAFMVTYTEWMMWDVDAGGESFRHIGQWGVLAATLVVIAAAVLPKLFSSLMEKKENWSFVPMKKTTP